MIELEAMYSCMFLMTIQYFYIFGTYQIHFIKILVILSNNNLKFLVSLDKSNITFLEIDYLVTQQ